MLSSSICFLLLCLSSMQLVVQAVSWAPFEPVSLPLSVRSPYLNVWLPQGNDPHPISKSWPYHWPSTEHVNLRGWRSVLVVDNEPYWIMGVDSGPDTSAPRYANVTSVSFTPTRTTFNLTAGPVNVQLACLSPIEVTDLTRLSLPFVYFYATITPTDGRPHAVRLGMGVTAELISGDHSLAANASSITSDDIIALQIGLQNPQPFVEIQDHPEDAIAYIATTNSAGVTYQVSSDADAMANLTALSNTLDSNYSSHALDTPFDIYEIMVDMGSVDETSSTVVFTIGIVRDPSINYVSLTGETQLRRPYFRANFTTTNDLISFVLNDFNRSLDSARTFDSNLMTAAMDVSSIYADLLSLTTRSSFSALDVTISQTPDGSLNTSDVKLFMKDMGGIGSRGVNAVSVLYSALPMYLYLAPDLLAYLLYPLLEAQDDPTYNQSYAAQHLGVGYPNATAQNTEHNFGIEESANMLILTLAHAQTTKDYSLISNFYNLLDGWAQYLVANALAPNAQQTSPFDGIPAINQTNLALKGVIGIAAMGTVSTLLGRTQDANNYNSTASLYMQQWLTLAKSADGSHILTAYGSENSTGLLYNLFADRILQLNIVPESVYLNQTILYRSMQGGETRGLPLQTGNPTLSRTDWSMFTAATCTDNTTRDALVSWIHQVASTNTNSTPLGVVFDPTSNIITGGTNSPAHGSMYSLLALSGAAMDITPDPSPSQTPLSNRDRKSPVAAVVGGIIGGILALAACIAMFLVCHRRKALKRTHPVSQFRSAQASESTASRNSIFPRFQVRNFREKSRRGTAVAGDVNGPDLLADTHDIHEAMSEEGHGGHVATSAVDQSIERRAPRDETELEMELRTLRTQVHRLLEHRRRESFISDVQPESECPPSYNSI